MGKLPFKRSYSNEKIEDVPLLLVHRTKGEGLYERIIEECERFEFQPNILCECPDINILLSLVETGIGASILPKSSVSEFRNIGIRVLDILDSSLQSEIALVNNDIFPKRHVDLSNYFS
ncbi:LysR family transcriptional regulator substrate-binding protein [Gottfriedia acidiceleris]|uniref:LysR family transcriptional regulator substrate-binding protein n=1 Tax=Bacillaceae TaxID=186817 RepID=UPI0025703711|nr:LysR family transcriptional regulator substrate-binding protein [Bacillus sp. AFS001701]